jgi:hypothetical protein
MDDALTALLKVEANLVAVENGREIVKENVCGDVLPDGLPNGLDAHCGKKPGHAFSHRDDDGPWCVTWSTASSKAEREAREKLRTMKS